MYFKKYIFSVILIIACIFNSNAQNVAGRDFWFTLPDNASLFRADEGLEALNNGENVIYVVSQFCIDSAYAIVGAYNDTIYFSVEPGNFTAVRIPFFKDDAVSFPVVDSAVPPFNSEQDIIPFYGDINTPVNKAVHIVSPQPISVFFLSYAAATADAETIIPTDFLGTEYVINTRANSAGYLTPCEEYPSPLITQGYVIATEDNTAITVNTWETDGTPVTYQSTLNKGQVYSWRGRRDCIDDYDLSLGCGSISGSTVEASKPVSVMSGSTCAFMAAAFACDVLMAQHLPISQLASEYVTVQVQERNDLDMFTDCNQFNTSSGDFVEVTGRIGETVTFVSKLGTETEIIPAPSGVNTDYGWGTIIKELPEDALNSGYADMQISGTGPLLVNQYSKGTTVDGISSSDPEHLTVFPTTFWEDSYFFYPVRTPTSEALEVVLVVEDIGSPAPISTIEVNGTNTGITGWNEVPNTNYKYKRLSYTKFEASRVESTEGYPFGLYFFARGEAESALFSGGYGPIQDLNLCDQCGEIDITINGSTCFGEEIAFEPRIYSFTRPSVLNYTWNFGDGTVSNEEFPTHTYAAEGQYTVTLQVSGTEGCILQAEKTVYVNSVAVNAEAIPDTLCRGDIAEVRPNFELIPGGDQVVQYRNNEEAPILIPDNGVRDFWDGTPFGASDFATSTVTVDGFYDTPGTIDSVCINLDHELVSDINIFLEIPGGTIYEVLTSPVSNGRTNLRKTCFSANALQNITNAFPPYTGTYQMEGGTYPPAQASPAINGDYRLLVGDESLNFTGEIVDWSLYISSEIGVASIDWTPGIAPFIFDQENATGNAKARPNNTTQYFVEVTDYSGCGNEDSVILDVQRLPVLLASTDTLLCNTEQAFNLMDLIRDTRAQGNGYWTWNPPTGIDSARLNGFTFDTRNLPEDGYTLKYHEDIFCGTDSAFVTLSINELPNLGNDAIDTLCDTQEPLNLFPYLGPDADAGGEWTSAPVLNGAQFSAGNLDPALLNQGNYSFFYSKPVEACPTFTSRVDLRINHQPNAGQNGDTIICESGTPLSLVGVLNGMPEGGGTWSDVDGSGGLILGNQFNSFDAPQNPNSQFFRFDYTIAGATACVDSTARATVNVLAAPEISLSANFPILCRDSTVQVDAVLEGNGDFDLEISDGLGNVYPPASALPVGNTYSFMQPLTQTTTFSVTRLIDNSSLRCPIVKPQSITVEVYDPIQAKLVSEDCILNPDGITFLGFVPQIEISGGSGGYSYDLFVDGTLVKSNASAPNAVHQLDTIPNGVEYSYRFYDGSNCPDVEAVFERKPRKYCECETFVGFMADASVEVCEYETAVVPEAQNDFLEPEDTLYYILHDRAGIVLGERLDSNATPEFTYKPGLEFNRTYYISAIAGDSLNGGIDPKDTCVSVADGTPVTFLPQPDVNFLSGGGAICEGDFFTVDIALSGNGPFTLIGNAITAQGITPFEFSDIDTNKLSFNPVENTTYEFTRIEDANTNTCFRVLNERITVEVFQLPRVRITNPDTVRICEGSITSIDLDIVGGTGPYRIEILKDGAPFGLPLTTSNNQVSFNVAQGGFYRISDIRDVGANCTGLVLDGSVFVVVKKQPTANAGASPIEPCGSSVDLEAIPSFGDGRWQDPGSGFTFSNRNSPQTIGVVPEPGAYTFIWEEENAPCPISRDTVFATFFTQPKADAGPDSLFCATVADLYATPSSDSATGFWIYNGTGDVTFTNPTSPNSTVVVGTSDTYELVWREQVDNRCVDFDTVAVTFSDFLRASVIDTICLNDGANYQFVFDVRGGDPNSLTVNGELIGELPYTSRVLNSGESYKFGFSDQSSCGFSDTIRTTYGCPCTSDAGTLNQDTIFACLGDVVSVQRETDMIRDPDDTTIYVLHTSSVDTLGGIILSKGSNDLRLTGNLVPGRVYYLSRVVGSRTASNPGVDLNEYCLSVAPGVPVVVGRPAQSVIVADSRVCEGEDVVLSVGGNGTGPYRFELRQGTTGTPFTVNLDTGDDFELLGLPAGDYTYYVSNFQDLGNSICTALQNQRFSFTVAPLPQADIAIPTQACVGSNVRVTADAADNIRVSWNFGNGDPTVTGNTRSYTYDAPGTYTITTTLFNTLTNCFTEQTQVVIIQALPQLNVRIDDLPDRNREVCVGESVVVQNVTPEPGVDYTWIVNGTPRTPYTPVFTLDDMQQDKEIVLEGITSAGCKSSTTLYINIIEPNANLDLPRTVCNESEFYLRFNSPSDVDSFEWNFQGETYTDNPALVPVQVLGQNPPTQLNVTLQLTSAEGCESTLSQTVALETVFAEIRFNPTDGEICLYDSIEVVSEDVSSNGLPANDIRFSYGDGRLTTLRSNKIKYAEPGTYTVRLQVSNSESACTDVTTKTVTVLAPPQVPNRTQEVCFNLSSDSLDATIPNGNTYTWLIDTLLTQDTLIQPLTGAKVEFSPTSDRKHPYSEPYRIAVQDNNECRDTADFIVNVVGIDSIPSFPANNDTLVVQGDSLLFDLPVLDGLIYEWQPKELFACPSCPEQTLVARETQEYTLRITDIYDCINEIRTFNIDIEENKYSLDVPDAFTPNGDGINDEIYPQGWGIESYEYFRIYNRFGELVFDGSGPNPRWDGTFEGEPAQPGDYVFNVSAKRFNQRIRSTLQGSFELIR